MAKLAVTDFDLEKRRISLSAKYTKNGATAVQPVPQDLAESLATYLQGREGLVWPSGWVDRCADMLKIDLAKAKIPYKTQEGFADFHALRHSFITSLEEAGLSVKEAQVLARHSDPKLTLARYTHKSLSDLGAKVDSACSGLVDDL